MALIFYSIPFSSSGYEFFDKSARFYLYYNRTYKNNYAINALSVERISFWWKFITRQSVSYINSNALNAIFYVKIVICVFHYNLCFASFRTEFNWFFSSFFFSKIKCYCSQIDDNEFIFFWWNIFFFAFVYFEKFTFYCAKLIHQMSKNYNIAAK